MQAKEPRCERPGCEEPGVHQCGKCHTTHYCSFNCQKEDWGTHKQLCGKPRTINVVQIPRGGTGRTTTGAVLCATPHSHTGVVAFHCGNRTSLSVVDKVSPATVEYLLREKRWVEEDVHTRAGDPSAAVTARIVVRDNADGWNWVGLAEQLGSVITEEPRLHSSTVLCALGHCFYAQSIEDLNAHQRNGALDTYRLLSLCAFGQEAFAPVLVFNDGWLPLNLRDIPQFKKWTVRKGDVGNQARRLLEAPKTSSESWKVAKNTLTNLSYILS